VTVFIPVGFSGDSEPSFSLWLTILLTVPLFLAAIAIFLYGISYRPNLFSWLWKFVPFSLIAFFTISWYLEFILYPEPDFPKWEIVMATLWGLLTLTPAFYISFKFGYSNLISTDTLNLKFSRKFIIIVSLVTMLCLGSHFIPKFEGKPKIKINYVAKLNEISKPTNYDPNDNAALYYIKAFDLCVEHPEQLSNSDLKAWPKDLSDEKLILLKKWVSDNTEALEQIKLGTQKSYYWLEYQGNSMWDIAMPSLANARKLSYAVCSRSKMKAEDGNFKEAFSDLLIGYKFGAHLNGRPTSLVEQLVGIAIRNLALQAGFQILDKEKQNPDLLKDFQLQLEGLSDSKSYIIDFTAEKLLVYDNIQRIFTDDGQGSGHIYGTRFGENKKSIEVFVGQYFTKEQMRNLAKLDRRQTSELADKVYEYLGRQAYKTPCQLHKEGQNIEKALEEMINDNFLLHLLMPAADRIMRSSYRGKAETDALITTIALLRYKAEKSQFPEKLQQLIESGYLKELPIDSFSDNPFVYKTTGNNFILYSLAADLDDDGGSPSKWGEGEEGGDQVFWPVNGEQK
jgi:hypothetical protein